MYVFILFYFFFLSSAGGGNLRKTLLFQQKNARFTIAGAYVLNPPPTHFNHYHSAGLP